MEEKSTLNRFITEMNLAEITDLEELRDICTTTDKYLESRATLVKHKEVEIFKKTLRLMEMKSKALGKLAIKQKQVESMKPEPDQTFVKYLLNKVFIFDMKGGLQLEKEDFKPSCTLEDGLRDHINTLLLLKDARDSIIRYILCFHSKSYRIEAVYNLSQNNETSRASRQEIHSLVGKLRDFIGVGYFGIKRLMVDSLQRFLDEKLEDSEVNETTMFGSNSHSTILFHY